MNEARTVVADPALGFSYQVVLDKEARRTLVFQAHVPVDASIEDVNAVLDKIGKAADRQIAIYELLEARRAVADHQRTAKTLAVQKENLEALARARYEASGRKGEWDEDKMPAQEKQAAANIKVSIERYREGLDKWQADVRRLEPLVNGHAPELSPDHHAGLSEG
jgi:hypothetical protein